MNDSPMKPYDVFVFPVIDWTFRHQRPQQLALELARRGHRIFYLTVDFAPADTARPYLFWDQPEENVFVVQLRCPGEAPSIYKQMPSPEQAAALLDAIDALRRNCGVGTTVSIVDLPFWRPIAMAMQGNLVVYDCMDYHPGFLNNESSMLVEEDRLIHEADLVLTTAAGLSEIVGRLRENTLIRNACDVTHFLRRPDRPVRRLSERPVVGYFGAIDHWFDVDLLVASARAYPDWDFILIGNSHGSDISPARALPNVRFLGEIPYAILPEYAHGFDVCIIPFEITELTLNTNPVKMYEYLATGRPMVGTAMPEIRIGRDGLVFVGEDHADFIAKLGQAMAVHDDPRLVEERVAYARAQTWGARIAQFDEALVPFFPKVSVVVLVYNGLELTRRCLDSIAANSHYPNLELILVDNASPQTEVRDLLVAFAKDRPWVKLVLNDRNLGFSGGNNAGLRVATGDYMVLLNNDTQVTRGWIFDMLRHFRRDPGIGMVGPVTNNIGNEARIEIAYDGHEAMCAASRLYVEARRGRTMPSDTVAFFCVMFSRAVFEAVGELDEIFGIGMFEDDDYCRRTRGAGFKVVIADDVFIHHELSASLNALGLERRQKLFEENKRLYEQKWGAWTPHKYRDPEAPQTVPAQTV